MKENPISEGLKELNGMIKLQDERLKSVKSLLDQAQDRLALVACPSDWSDHRIRILLADLQRELRSLDAALAKKVITDEPVWIKPPR